MIQYIVNSFPNYEFGVYCSDESFKIPFAGIDNLVFLDKISKEKYMRESDFCLFLGGSIYQIKTFRILLSFIKRYLQLIIYKRKGKKIITLGANLGPFYNGVAESVTHKILGLHDLIIVRYEESYNSISKELNVHLAYDIVYEASSIFQSKVTQSKSINGISVYRSVDPDFDNTKLSDSYITYIKHLISQNNETEIRLFTFNSGHENDSIIADEIAEIIKSDKVTVVKYEGDVQSFLSKFSQCDTMVATRFHSAILADIFKIPFYALAYSNKMINYLKDKTIIKPLHLNNETIVLSDYCVKSNQILLEDISRERLYFQEFLKILESE